MNGTPLAPLFWGLFTPLVLPFLSYMVHSVPIFIKINSPIAMNIH